MCDSNKILKNQTSIHIIIIQFTLNLELTGCDEKLKAITFVRRSN